MLLLTSYFPNTSPSANGPSIGSTMTTYQCRWTALCFSLPMLAIYIQVSLMEGVLFGASHAAATKTTSTSRILSSLSSVGLSYPYATTGFIQPSLFHKRKGLSSRSHPPVSTSPHQSYYTHNYITTILQPQRRPRFGCYACSTTARFSSNQNEDTIDATVNAEEEDDDECSLQKLYQQVQTEDSDWYYQTFSKLLDVVGVDDPMQELALCDKSDTNDGVEIVTGDSDNDIKMKNDISDEANSDNVDKFGGNALGSTSIDELIKADVDKTSIDSKAKENEMSHSSISNEIDKPGGVNQVTMQKVERGKGQTSGDRVQVGELDDVKEEPSFRDMAQDNENDAKLPLSNKTQDREDEISSDRTQTIQQKRRSSLNGREEYERKNDDDNNNNYEVEDREDTQPPRMKLPVDNVSPVSRANEQQPQSPLSSPTLMVRLRNTYTGEVVKLCPLSTLLNVGYSKKEVLVLRPKVLELIIEDRIPRPKKGLPKRWVRLSRLEEYDGKSEEEDEDEDFDWEVEVLAKKTSDKLAGSDRQKNKDSEGSINEKTKKSSQIREINEPTTTKIGASEVADNERTESVSKTTKRSSDTKEIDQVSESWGPFTSSRLSNTDTGDDAVREQTTSENPKQKRRAVRDEERYDDTQRPPQMKKRRNDDRSKYIEVDDGATDRRYDDDDRRPPQPLRRKRVDDSESRSKTPSQRSSVANEERRRQRQRQRPMDQRRELTIDRGDDDEPPPNKFWMDLPTFRDYLRTEAQLRLKILGPDWKESVLDESRWRYDLYKTWLTMLGEGVGENPLYEYGERSRRPEERRRSPPPPPRSRGDTEAGGSQRQGRQKGRDLEKEEYYASYGKTVRPRGRSELPLEEQNYRNREQRNPPPDRRPRPQSTRGSTWRNFSDLEESLQSSRQERSRLVRRAPMEVDDEEDDDYFDEVYDERRSRSNPSRATRDNGARREYTEPENELPYESERTARKGNGYTSELEDFDEIE